MRNGVEAPAQLAAMHVKGADIAGGGGRSFGGAEIHDDHVAPDGAGRGERQADRVHVTIQPGAQINATRFAKIGQRFSGGRIQRIQISAGRREQPPLVSLAPQGQAALRPTRLDPGMEAPLQFSRRPVQRDGVQAGGIGIDDAAHRQGMGLGIAHLGHVEAPGLFQLAHIGAGDLRQAGKAPPALAAIQRPITLGGGALAECRPGEGQQTQPKRPVLLVVCHGVRNNPARA